MDFVTEAVKLTLLKMCVFATLVMIIRFSRKCEWNHMSLLIDSFIFVCVGVTCVLPSITVIRGCGLNIDFYLPSFVYYLNCF